MSVLEKSWQGSLNIANDGQKNWKLNPNFKWNLEYPGFSQMIWSMSSVKYILSSDILK